MKGKLFLIALTAALLLVGRGFAYQVWIGTHCTPSNAAVYLNAWSNTAAQVTGIDAVTAPCLPTVGNPDENDTSCGTAQWKAVFGAYVARNNAYVEVPRSSITLHGPLTNYVESLFTGAKTYGYGFTRIMFYDNATGGTNYNWTTDEVQQMRDYLDGTGRTNIGLMYDARNNSAGVRAWCTNSLVVDVVLEAALQDWLTNLGSRQQLLPWLWTNPATAGKRLIFQMPPVASPPPYSETNNFMSTRRLIQWLGVTLMDYNFMRSSNVIFMPVTYNGPTITYIPETATPQLYTNTMTSLTLSLIEQRALFEGRLAWLPTQADADSLVRGFPPTISSLPDVVVNDDTPTNIAFTIGDPDTDVSLLTVTTVTTNSSLVPATNFVFGGSSSNRTMTITPALNQTGTTTITLIVSDGLYTATNSFNYTVVAGPDTDGDGMLDGAELGLGRNPNSAADLGFEFNSDDNFDGWGSFMNITNTAVSGGSINGASATTDPHFSRSGFNFAGNSVSNIVIKIQMSATNIVQFFWGRVGGTAFSSTRALGAAYRATNTWQLITFPLAANSEWQNQTITSLRIDPGTVAGRTFAIDWIRAMSGNPNVFNVSSTACTNGIFSMNINGQAGVNYVVQISTNLTTWLSVWTNSPLTPPFQFTAAATNFNRQFYRIALAP